MLKILTTRTGHTTIMTIIKCGIVNCNGNGSRYANAARKWVKTLNMSATPNGRKNRAI